MRGRWERAREKAKAAHREMCRFCFGSGLRRRWSWSPRPGVVRAIDVDDPLVGIELDLRQLLAVEPIDADVDLGVRAPDFGWIVEVLRRAVGEGELRADRHDAARVVPERDEHRIDLADLLVHHGVDGLV